MQKERIASDEAIRRRFRLKELEMNMLRASSGMLLFMLTLCLASLVPVRADAVVWARVTLRGATITETTVGGSGVLTAQHDDVGTISDSFHTRTTGGDLTSDATRGRLEGSVFYEIEIPGSFSRVSGYVEKYIYQQDHYTIGAGTTGLSNGDPVQIRLQATLAGRLIVNGRPAGLSEMLFNVSGVPGDAGPWINWNTGLVNPPQDIEVDEAWDRILDTTVGASFTLMSNLESTLNGTAFDGPVVDANQANATATVRVSPAPGFEGLDIVSEAGAPTGPLPQVPLSSPITLVLLVGLLITTGSVLAVSWRSRARLNA
jgi:hypothetical protein